MTTADNCQSHSDECKQAFLAQLKELDERVRACEAEDCSFENYENTQIFDDYSINLTKECTMLKAMDKLGEKVEKLHSQIEAFREKLQAEKKVDKFKFQCDEIDKKFETTKKRSDEIDRISDFLGFQVELKEDNVYTAEFTKLPINDPEMRFTFDILDNDTTLKVLRCEPPQCLDTTEIETQVEPLDECNRFYKLLLLIRHQLIQKYQN